MVLNAGIVANLMLGFGLLAISNATGRPLHAIVLGGLSAGCWFARRIVAAYVAPALAVPALALMGWALSQSWAEVACLGGTWRRPFRARSRAVVEDRSVCKGRGLPPAKASSG